MAAFKPLALLSLVTSVTLSNAVVGGGVPRGGTKKSPQPIRAEAVLALVVVIVEVDGETCPMNSTKRMTVMKPMMTVVKLILAAAVVALTTVFVLTATTIIDGKGRYVPSAADAEGGVFITDTKTGAVKFCYNGDGRVVCTYYTGA